MTSTRTQIAAALTFTALLVATLSSCGGSKPSAQPPASTTSPTTTFAIDPGDGGNYHPAIDPSNFVEVIDNPYMPLTARSRWRHEGTSNGEPQTTEITVTSQRKEILGISATVVRDTVKENGVLIEDTIDWFAQDRDGNVWYLGEASKEYENGKVVSTAGSWEAGVDGVQPGIVMPGRPKVGDVYRQEYYRGEAEDMMEIVSLDGTAETRAGSYRDLVVTNDWNPLEPEIVEQKSYAKGIGRVLEQKTAGEQGRSALVEYKLGR